MFFALENTRYMQYVAALAATASITSGVMYVSWSSPTLPLLTSEDSPIGVTLTADQASWVASIVLLAGAPAAPVAVGIIDKLGRKTSLLSITPFYVLPWIWIIFASSFWELLVARTIGGMALIIGTVACSIYNGEIADKDIRGKLGTSFSLMKLVGTILVLSVGPFVSYTVLAIISAIVPLIFFSIFYFMPESPYHLMRIGKREEAKKSLIRLAAKNFDPKMIEEKLELIQITVDNDMKNKMGFTEFLIGKEYRKLIFIMFGVKTAQQMSGLSAMDSYMQTIIQISGSSISPDISSIIFGVVQLPAALLASFTVDKFGRKPILLISSFGCAAALIAEGTYFYLQDFTNNEIESISWLPTTAMTFFLVMGTFGICNLPYVLLGELFPTNVKTAAVTTATTYGALLGFTSTKIFEPISEAAGTCTVFWIYAGFCIFGFLFVLYFLPETKGKTFIEIQEKINGKRKN